MSRAISRDITSDKLVDGVSELGRWRTVRRAIAAATVSQGDVGFLVPYYNTTYAAKPVMQFVTDSTGLGLGDVREVGVVEFNAGEGDTGAANTFVDVVVQGAVATVKVLVGTAHAVSTGDYLEYSATAPSRLLKTSLGQTSKYCVGLATSAASAGTEATSEATISAMIGGPLKVVNTTSVTAW